MIGLKQGTRSGLTAEGFFFFGGGQSQPMAVLTSQACQNTMQPESPEVQVKLACSAHPPTKYTPLGRMSEHA